MFPATRAEICCSVLHSDVVALNPDWVSICIGINDVWRQFDSPAIPDGQVMPEEYEANLEKMILSVKGKVKGIFILTPYYMEPNPQDWMRKRMDEYGAICKKLAAKHGCCLVDLQEVFNRYFEYRHSSYIAGDRVHPNLSAATVNRKSFYPTAVLNTTISLQKKKCRPVKRQSVHRFFACTNRGSGL